MKLLRCGAVGEEKPAALDRFGKIRDLSSYTEDFNQENIKEFQQHTQDINKKYQTYCGT